MEGKENSDEKMMKFLSEMEVLQRTDPESFAQFLASMGMGGESREESELGRKTIIDAISQLREAKNSTPDGNIELPGGQTLSGGEVKPKMKGINITPEPGFTVKTKMESGSKVFINVCKHSELAVPAIKKKLDENGEEVEGMNIPLSAGPARSGMDKSGVACVIYDVIVNPQVIEDVFSDQTGRHRDFICQLAIQSIEQKNKLVLDKRYKLPKVRYMGEIASQHIQDRKNMPNIQEMSSSQSPGLTAASSTSKKAAGKADKEPIAEPLVEKPLQFQLKWKRIGGLMDEVEHEEGEAAGMQFNPPLTVPDDDVTHVVFLSTFDISSDAISQNDVQVSLSPYRIQVKVPGYLLAAAYFPCAVHSGDTFGSSTSASLGDETDSLSPRRRAVQLAATMPSSTLSRPAGYTSLLQICVACPVDRTPWIASADPGSKPWMVTEALTGGGQGSSRGLAEKKTEGDGPNDDFPEDKFHIRLPDDVDKYTGVKLETGGEEEFAEDKFHKQDAVSQYIIEQRERDIKAKWEKHEKEKAERGNDPNVEYIDVDDFKVGGKYGPSRSQGEASAELEQQDELRKAAGVVASSFAAAAASSTPEEAGSALGLSCNLWTELLD